MRKLIPGHVIAVVGGLAADAETHASLDSLFMYAGAPGDPPDGSRLVKAQEWLRRVNKDEQADPMSVLGRVIEAYMEAELDDPTMGTHWRERREKLERALGRAELQYVKGGRLSGALGVPTRALEDLIRGRDLAAIEEEFTRAVANVDVSPRDAISAACNILESVCKVCIEDEGLEPPKKQDLRFVWDVVRKHLGFDPSRVEDRDLKEILSGLFSIVGGIAALRTHASSAHGAGRRLYRLEPRHARLAVHSAHTVVAYVIESWDWKRGGGADAPGA